MREFKVIISFAILLSMLASGCSDQIKNTQDVSFDLHWSGDFPVSKLSCLPEEYRQSSVGFIGNAGQFESAWRAFKVSEPVPVVNFRKNLVVFVRNIQFYNRISIRKATLTNGVLNILAMETMSAMPIEDKVAMAMAVVPRAGIKLIRNGNTYISLAPNVILNSGSEDDSN